MRTSSSGSPQFRLFKLHAVYFRSHIFSIWHSIDKQRNWCGIHLHDSKDVHHMSGLNRRRTAIKTREWVMPTAVLLYGETGSSEKCVAHLEDTMGVQFVTFDTLSTSRRIRLFFASLYAFAVVDLDSFTPREKTKILLYASRAPRPIIFLTTNELLFHVTRIWLAFCRRMGTTHTCGIQLDPKEKSHRALAVTYCSLIPSR